MDSGMNVVVILMVMVMSMVLVMVMVMMMVMAMAMVKRGLYLNGFDEQKGRKRRYEGFQRPSVI